MWLLAKRLRKLSVEEHRLAYELPDLIAGPDLRGAPRIQLQDSDGDIADEFWEERPGPGGSVLEESRAPGTLSLALVQGDDSFPSNLGHAEKQVRQELSLRSVHELKILLDRSGAGSSGLLQKAELVDRILYCVTSLASEMPDGPRISPDPTGLRRSGCT